MLNVLIVLVLYLSTYIAIADDLASKLQLVAGIYEDSSKATSMGVGKAVLVTGCNYGFLNHLHNFDCFMKRLGMKYIVMAMDTKVYDYLQQNTSIVAYHLTGADSSDVTSLPQEFRSKNFNIITAKKKEAVHKILNLGYDVLFADTDVAILRDPLPYMIWENVDYVHSLNAFCKVNEFWDFFYKSKLEGNTGFYFVRSNNQTIKLWLDAFNAAPKFPRLDDQAVFWKVIRKSVDPPILPIQKCRHFQDTTKLIHEKYNKRQLIACMLDTCIFSSGMLSRMYVPELTYETLQDNLKTLKETMCTVHANYISGNQKKKQKMEDYGLWLAQQDASGRYTCKNYVPWQNTTLSTTL